jgi:FMN-dependent NADH-azoreductase
MASLLYIESSPRRERSASIQTARAFLDAYKQARPNDTIRTLNVFETALPAFDGFTINAKYTILHGGKPTAQEKDAWQNVEAVIEDFKRADKYVFAVPMWNFGIPYRLKHYIDVLVQPGYTFKVGPNGYEGLVTGKPAMAIYARGGSYREGTPGAALDMQKRYLDAILRFIGFEDIRSLEVESTLEGGAEGEKKAVEEAKRRAGQMATDF